MDITLTINGREGHFKIRPNTLLIDLLRRNRYFSVKHGCETGDCGACAVLLDGRAVNTCIMLAAQAHGKSIVTVEGLSQGEEPHPLQESFVETGAIQCGYCTPAMILAAQDLLNRNTHPSVDEVRDALAGVLCRCTGYVKPVEAILRTSRPQDRTEGGEHSHE